MRVRDPPELHSRSQTRVRRARHRHPLPYFLFPLKNTAEPSPQPTGCMSATNPARCREPWDERTAAPRHTRDHQTWLRGNAGARGTFPLSTGCYLHSKSRQRFCFVQSSPALVSLTRRYVCIICSGYRMFISNDPARDA